MLTTLLDAAGLALLVAAALVAFGPAAALFAAGAACLWASWSLARSGR